MFLPVASGSNVTSITEQENVIVHCTAEVLVQFTACPGSWFIPCPLGHTPTPFLSVECCCLHLFPGESHCMLILLDYPSPVCPWPTWFLLKPGTSWYSVCSGMCWWSIHIVWPSQRSLLSLRLFARDRMNWPLLFWDRISNYTNLFRPEPNWTKPCG